MSKKKSFAQRVVDKAYYAVNGKPKTFRRFPHAKKRNMFEGAQQTSITHSWTTTPQPINEVLKKNLKTLRARSREQQFNNDYARRFIGMCKSNVVGDKGIVLQAKSKSKNGELDVMANQAIEAAYKDWSKPENCDVKGRCSREEMERLFISTVAGDGECIVRMIYGKSVSKYGFALQFIDPELLDADLNEDIRGSSNKIKMGIEVNQYDKPIAYYFKQTAGDYYYNGKHYTRVPAKDIIHGFITEYVDQMRGIPWMSTALLRLNMLGGFENAALVNARVGASKMGFFTSESGDDYKGDGTENENGTGNTISESEPGTFEQLQAGTTFTAFDPAYPNGEYTYFLKGMLRGIASGLGANYNTLANDLEGVNYSSLREGAINEREIWKLLQNWMITSFSSIIYNKWLERVILSPGIPIGKTRLQPEMIDKYRDVYFQGKRWQWVDPLKEMNGNQAAIDARIKSRSQIIRANGDDPRVRTPRVSLDRCREWSVGFGGEGLDRQRRGTRRSATPGPSPEY